MARWFDSVSLCEVITTVNATVERTPSETYAPASARVSNMQAGCRAVARHPTFDSYHSIATRCSPTYLLPSGIPPRLARSAASDEFACRPLAH